MTVASGNFAELLWPGIASLWAESYNDYEPLYAKCFSVKDSNKRFEKEQGVTGLPLAGVKDEGNAIPYVDPFQGYQKEYVNVTYAIGSSVTREMYEDDMYGYINTIPGMLARSMRQTEETTSANVLNNGFTATVTGADGVSLFNASHPLVGGGTFRNQLATAADLTQTSLEQALQDVRDPAVMAVDDQSLKILIQPRCLVVHPQNQFRAHKLLQSTYVTQSANNDVNPLVGLFTDLVVNPYLTDADAWYITTDVPNGLTWYWRRRAEMGRDNEFDTENLKFKNTGRWSVSWTDGRGAYATPGA